MPAYPTTKLDRAVDSAIAAENAAYLADPELQEFDRKMADRWRIDCEKRGLLPPLNNKKDW